MRDSLLALAKSNHITLKLLTVSTDIQQKKFHGYMYMYLYRDQYYTVEEKIQESQQVIFLKNLTFQKTDLINRRMFSTLTSRFIPFSRNTKTSSTLEPTCWPKSDNLFTT